VQSSGAIAPDDCRTVLRSLRDVAADAPDGLTRQAGVLTLATGWRSESRRAIAANRRRRTRISLRSGRSRKRNLLGLERRYDPGNLFRLDQNIAPAAG
jgi:hypothetical protein